MSFVYSEDMWANAPPNSYTSDGVTWQAIPEAHVDEAEAIAAEYNAVNQPMTMDEWNGWAANEQPNYEAAVETYQENQVTKAAIISAQLGQSVGAEIISQAKIAEQPIVAPAIVGEGYYTQDDIIEAFQVGYGLGKGGF
jgi:hypothetical protein